MGPKGRKQLVESWSQYLPLYTQTETINHQANSPPERNNGHAGQPPHTPDPVVSILTKWGFKKLERCL